MDEEALNISVRKFLKKLGVTAQRELVAGRCRDIQRNEWRTVSGPHALVFLEAWFREL
jgi:Family of unknown function (DUF6494)